jgi:hypothetical protein
MIGSPASRGAVASVGAAGRGGVFATVPVVSAAIAANVTRLEYPQRRIAAVGRAGVDRITIPCLGRNASKVCVDRMIDRIFGLTNRRHRRRRQFAPKSTIGRFL